MKPDRPRALICGRGEEALRLYAAAVRSTGAHCRVIKWHAAAPEEARRERFDVSLLVGLRPSERSAVAPRTGELASPWTVAITGPECLPNELDERVDLAVLLPTSAEAILYAAGLWGGDWASVAEVAPDLLVGISTLGETQDAVDGAMRQLMKAYGAIACVLLTPGGGTWVGALGQRARAEPRQKLIDGARMALRSSSAIALPAVLKSHDGSAPPVESYLAMPLTEAAGVRENGLCLVVPGAMRIHCAQREVLRAVVSRLGSELAQRSLNRRLVADLQASRDSGGMDSRFGVWSRAALAPLFDMLSGGQQRSGGPMAVAVADVRGMAKINDRFGSAMGDEVLRHVASVARSVVRCQDAVAHFGGDDIAIVMTGATAQQAQGTIRRLRDRLRSQPFCPQPAVAIDIDIAAGIVPAGVDDSAEEVFARAARVANEARSSQDEAIIVRSTVARGSHSGSVADVLSADLNGTILGGCYRLRNVIASGGVGVVFRADDLALRRPVAVKVLRPELANDATLIERFRDEGAILASLRHPNVVQVYSAGADDEHVFFAMELIEGQSLSETIHDLCREQRYPSIAYVSQIIEQVAAALDALHDRSVLHRDVKPANVMVDPFRNRVVLVDVGLARRRGDANDVAGTPGYIAPEVLAGGDFSPATDVYGLAATAYELLVLRQPWPSVGNPMELLALQASEPPVAPSVRRPDLGTALDEILLRGLRRDPTERWASAGEFSRALRAVLASGGGDQTRELVHIASNARSTEDVSSESTVARTRGIAFRVAARAVSSRQRASWQRHLAASAPELSAAVSPGGAAMRWHPSELFVELLASYPDSAKTPAEFGRELGRATIRATFRRLFPAASSTLVPSNTLRAMPVIWRRYHSWGHLEIAIRPNRATVRMRDPLCRDGVREWLCGMLEQLVRLSGGSAVRIEIASSEASAETTWELNACWLMAEKSAGVAQAASGSDPGGDQTMLGAPALRLPGEEVEPS